jgi:Tfp pilus tip-associated adhesin PilY1
MLSDIGQGALAFVDDPAVADSLGEYGVWARGIAPADPIIYVQTNDGILHVVDPNTGEEELAIVPPPVLVPSRIASFKNRFLTEGKYEWLDVLGEEDATKIGDAVRTRSIPAYTLDGALQKRAFSTSPTGAADSWHMWLLAGLGRGGSGLYMMNVTEDGDDGDEHYRDKPKLMWYKERIGKDLLELVPDIYGDLITDQDGRPMIRSLIAGSPELKLGFNSPKAAMGVTGSPGNMTNFIALAGGSQNSIDLENNGDEGAVLLMLNPETGALLKSFGAADVENKDSIGESSPGPHPAMGMMVSEPALLRTPNNIKEGPYLAGSVFAADNRGTIFRVDMEEVIGNSISDLEPAKWKINAVATLHSTAADAKESTDSYSIPFGVQAARDGAGYAWISGGTSNLRTRNDGANPSGLLKNKSQMIFAFRTQSGHAIYGAKDLKKLDDVAADSVLTDADLKDDKHGWKIDLPAASAGLSEEYVSAKPLLVNGILYVPTFQEGRINWTLESMCSFGVRATGTSRLFVLDVTSGRGRWSSGDKFATLEGAKITGISVSEYGKKKRIVVTYDNLSGGEVNLAGAENDTQHVIPMSSFIFEAIGGGGINLDKGQNVVQYWVNN